MNKLFVAASAAALLTAAGTLPSLAQSSSSTGAGAAVMPSITCRDLSGMDQQTARNVVFYLGGLHAASGASSAMNTTTGSGSSSTTADAAGSTTGSSDTSSSSTTADAGTSGSTAGSSSTTADSGTAGSTTDTTGSTTAAGSGSSNTSSAAGGSAVMAQLPGFSMINADQIISTCQGAPDRQLSDVLGSGGSSAQ